MVHGLRGGFAGRHAHTGPRHARPSSISELLARPQKRTWQAFTTGLGIFTMVAVCGLSSFFIVADERQGRDAQASGVAPPPVPVFRDISSREADPAPLTATEVFPGEEVVVDPARPAYRVLRTRVDRRCAAGASGEIGALLTDLGCDQVVRGTLRAAGGYLVTAGIFNLDDVEGANWARQKIKPMVDGGRGRFQGLTAGKGTEAIALSSARVGWHVRGHYLVYCVAARADGRPIAAGDAQAEQILTDMLELYLRGTILEKRALISPSP